MLYCILRSCMMRPAKQLLLIIDVSGVINFLMSGIYCSRNLYNLLSFIFFLMSRYHEIGGVRDIMYLSLSLLPPPVYYFCRISHYNSVGRYIFYDYSTSTYRCPFTNSYVSYYANIRSYCYFIFYNW